MPKGNTQYLTEHDIRMWLRDNDPDSNFLINDLEFSKEEIEIAMTYCQDYWNETPPYIGNMEYTVTPFRFNLMQGSAAQLFFMAANRYRRNAFNYTAGGLSVQDQEKAQAYEGSAARMWAAYKEWVDKAKHAVNTSQGWGYVS